MEIKTRKIIEKKKIAELDMMSVYLIYDHETGQSNLLIVDINRHGIILQRASNENSLVVLGANKDTEVDVIGKVNDMTIIDVELRR